MPPAPTGLAATAGNAQVALTWGAASGATSYNVKRSTTNGGPYSNVQTNVDGTSFTNTGLTNGTTYYYVVTAVNANGESGVSTQAAGTPSAGPGPAAWRRRDRHAFGEAPARGTASCRFAWPTRSPSRR